MLPCDREVGRELRHRHASYVPCSHVVGQHARELLPPSWTLYPLVDINGQVLGSHAERRAAPTPNMTSDWGFGAGSDLVRDACREPPTEARQAVRGRARPVMARTSAIDALLELGEEVVLEHHVRFIVATANADGSTKIGRFGLKVFATRQGDRRKRDFGEYRSEPPARWLRSSHVRRARVVGRHVHSC